MYLSYRESTLKAMQGESALKALYTSHINLVRLFPPSPLLAQGGRAGSRSVKSVHLSRRAIPGSASVGSADHSQVDGVGLRYVFVNFEAKTSAARQIGEPEPDPGKSTAVFLSLRRGGHVFVSHKKEMKDKSGFVSQVQQA